MLATETPRPGLSRPGHGESEQKLIFVVAEPDFLVECLAEVLERRFPDHDIIVANDTVDVLKHHTADVRLVLFHRKDTRDIARVLRGIEAYAPSTAVGVLIDDPGSLDPLLNLLVEGLHIDGILPLDVRLDVFLAGVDLLVKGGEHFPSALLRRLKAARPSPGLPGARSVSDLLTRQANIDIEEIGSLGSHLTTREVEILDLLCKGTQNKLIAHRLNLSENTIKAHVRNIYRKLHVRNRTEAALRCFDGPHTPNAKHAVRGAHKE
jgi:DNA-binding NarL/FixJ family response regulator